MAHLILMPKAGQSMTEGRIVEWLKQEGDDVERGEPLLEIETDKANLEVEAAEAGVLRKIYSAAGEVCPVLSAIGVIGEADEEIDFDALRAEAAEAASRDSEDAAPEAPKPAAAQTAAQKPASATAPTSSRAPATTARHGDDTAPRRVFASPLARRVASERGVEVRGLRGSGPGGRILRRDVDGAAAATVGFDGANPPLPPGTSKPYPPPSPRPTSSVPLEGMRGAIATALQQSKSTIPHFYTTLAIDMGTALQVKETFKRNGARVSVNDLILRACATSLMDEPLVNCRVFDDHIEYPETANLGLAVGSDAGLVVPVIVGADAYDLAELAAESRRVIGLAQEGKLVGTGQGTFTVSNLGMFGVESFTAIINPPEGAILAIGAVRHELVPVGGGFFPRPMLRVTLSCDHRAIDGLLAARFLGRLKHRLEAGNF